MIVTRTIFSSKNIATSGNKSVKLCIPNAKAEYTGLYAYSNGFIEACSTIHDVK